MAAQGYIGRAPGESSVIVARQTFTPTGITTNFTFASGYTVGYVDAYLNGARLIEGDDYTATDGSVVGLTTHAINGDVLELVVYKAFNATNVQAAKDDFSVGGDATITGTLTVGGVEVQPGAAGTWASYDTNTGISTTKKVKITNNLEVTGAASTFSGNLNVGGVLTYDDVTNVDSIGIITARSHVSIADSILHTGDTDTSIRFPAADTFTVETAGSERLRVDSNGHVGINTIPSSWESGADTSVLQIDGASVACINDTDFFATSNAYWDGSNWEYIQTGEAVSYYQYNDERKHVFRSAASGSPGGTVSWTNQLVIDTTGAILTGIATVTEGLVLDGQNGSGKGLRLDLAGSGDYIIQETTTDDVVQFGGTGSSNFFTHNISSGRIGIGQTNPQGDLHIGDISGNKDLIMHSVNNGTATLRFREGGNTESGYNEYSVGMVGAANAMTVNGQGAGEIIRIMGDDGDVGIGTNNPSTAVHILSDNTGGDLTVERDGDGSAGPEIILRHTSVSPADNDFIGQIIFSGRDDADNNTTVVRIDGVMTDVSNGSEDGELVFNTRNDGTFAERVRIDSAGRILRGVSSSYANASIDDLQIGDNTSSTQRGLTIGSTDECAIAFADAGDTRAGSITYNHGQDAMIIKTEGQNTRLTINRAGGEFTGVCTATQFDATSDVTLKENITVIDEPINKLSELKGVTFDWKAGGHSVGVIAQDVEKVLPTAVGGSEDRKTVNYNAIIGLLVESVKDQQKQIEELKSLLDK